MHIYRGNNLNWIATSTILNSIILNMFNMSGFLLEYELQVT